MLPEQRARVARRRTCEVDAQIVILLDLPDRPAVMVPEIVAIEQHLAVSSRPARLRAVPARANEVLATRIPAPVARPSRWALSRARNQIQEAVQCPASRAHAPISFANAPLRAAAYTRVSTVLKPEADCPCPIRPTRFQGWCQAHGYVLSATFEERGASATSDKGRPQLKALLDQGLRRSRPYERRRRRAQPQPLPSATSFALEGARRRLAEHGVGWTRSRSRWPGTTPQPPDPQRAAMFDEYTSPGRTAST